MNLDRDLNELHKDDIVLDHSSDSFAVVIEEPDSDWIDAKIQYLDNKEVDTIFTSWLRKLTAATYKELKEEHLDFLRRLEEAYKLVEKTK